MLTQPFFLLTHHPTAHHAKIAIPKHIYAFCWIHQLLLQTMSNKLIETTATHCQCFLQIWHHSVKKHSTRGGASVLSACEAIWGRRHQSEKSNMAGWQKKDSILQRNVLELADRNRKEVSCTGELLGHGLKYTLRLVWKENLRWL